MKLITNTSPAPATLSIRLEDDTGRIIGLIEQYTTNPERWSARSYTLDAEVHKVSFGIESQEAAVASVVEQLKSYNGT